MRKMTAYMEVYLDLKKKIREGTYKTGMLLPTEPELETMYGVSRITIRKAMAMLADDGYVNIVQGKGTEVCDITTIQRLNSVTSITETLQKKGYHMTVQGMDIEEVTPPPYVAEALKIDKDTTVYKLQRIRCADGVPFSITIDYLKKEYVPGLKAYEGTFVGLYDFIERTYGLVMTEAYEYVSAASADFLEAQVLGVATGTALLYSRRIGYVEQGPFEYTVNKMIGDRYEFSVYMQGRS